MRTLVCSPSTAPPARVRWNVGFRSALVRYSGGSGNLDNLDDEATDLNDARQEVKDAIKANAEKLEHKETMTDITKDWPFPLSDTLPGMIRLTLAKVLTDIYTAAGGQDALSFQNLAYNASEAEIKVAIPIASQLSQINIAAEAMRRSMEQLKLATTTSLTLTLGKEAGDRE